MEKNKRVAIANRFDVIFYAYCIKIRKVAAIPIAEAMCTGCRKDRGGNLRVQLAASIISPDLWFLNSL